MKKLTLICGKKMPIIIDGKAVPYSNQEASASIEFDLDSTSIEEAKKDLTEALEASRSVMSGFEMLPEESQKAEEKTKKERLFPDDFFRIDSMNSITKYLNEGLNEDEIIEKIKETFVISKAAEEQARKTINSLKKWKSQKCTFT